VVSLIIFHHWCFLYAGNHDGVGDTNADVLLVYPFVCDAVIEKAAMQLSLCNYHFSVNADYVKLQCEKAVGRNHIVTITQCDWNSLQSQSFVNDAIIEFWLLWILIFLSWAHIITVNYVDWGVFR
jgi:hypothetical protein